jgi:hypothetical protein
VRSSASAGSRRSTSIPRTASTIRTSPKRTWQKSSATRGSHRSWVHPWNRQNGTLARPSCEFGDHGHPGGTAQAEPYRARLTRHRRGLAAARGGRHEELTRSAEDGDRSRKTGRGPAAWVLAARQPGVRSIHVPLEGEEVGKLRGGVDVYFHDRVHPLAPPLME